MKVKSTLAALSLGTAMALSLGQGAVAADAKPVSIVVNAMQIFSTLDPAKISDYTDYMAAVNMYDGLTTVDAKGQIVPHLAKSWDVSADGLTYTFHLRDDVKFQNGDPMTSADVVWSLDRLIAINKGPASLIQGLVTSGDISAPDAHTVVFKLTKVFSPFLAITPSFLVLDKKAVLANATADDKWGQAYVGDHSVGTGPYALVSYNRAADLVIKRNPDYFLGWTKGTPIDEIRFVQTSDDATVKALAQKGELGLSSTGLAIDTYKQLAKMKGYKVISTTTGSSYTLEFNTKVAPTDDVHFRLAVAAAIDYATIQSEIRPGKGMAGPLSSTFAAAHDDDLKVAKQDMDLAKAELAKSK
ncbi:ABC transporter substrate-binding protein, partial [Thioclava sp. BHET1]